MAGFQPETNDNCAMAYQMHREVIRKRYFSIFHYLLILDTPFQYRSMFGRRSTGVPRNGESSLIDIGRLVK